MNCTLKIINEETSILSFRGKWGFLSNFYPSNIEYEGVVYPTNENFYQAMKSTSTLYRDKMITVSPSEAKKLGQLVSIRKDWNIIKLAFMEYGIRKKFNDHELKTKLISTKNIPIYEGNTWGDTFWGVDLNNGMIGHNHLGKIIMRIREELKNSQ